MKPKSDKKRLSNERGLMFVCYQTSIDEQFEFITTTWVNDRAFPPSPPALGGNAGHDPILGQLEVQFAPEDFEGQS